MEEEVKNLRTISKDGNKKNKIPAGSKILKKDTNITVEEIENGFIISKNFDIRYQLKDSEHSEYMYYTLKFYSKTNPIEIKDTTANKELADLFD